MIKTKKVHKNVKQLCIEDTRRIIGQLKPKDDIFFGMLMKNREVCQEVLRVILGDPGLVVENCEDQKSFTNSVMRSVRVDAFCKFSSGEYGSVEMQRSSEQGKFSWHERRVRYNASSITIHTLWKGQDFSDIPKLYMVYITEKDIFGGNKALYQVKRSIETAEGQSIELDNGLYEYYANLAVKDKTLVAELLSLFDESKVVENTKFPRFTECIKYFKENEEGMKYMNTMLQELVEEGKREGREEGREREKAESLVNHIKNAMRCLEISVEKACEIIGCTIEEYENALQFVQQEKDSKQ